MNRTQERAVAAMRAIGNTVTDAPPLPPPPAGASRSARRTGPGARDGRAWRGWLIPAAAAVAMLAIAVSLVVVRSVVRGAAAPPGGTASATPGKGTNTPPPYYVTLPVYGWYAYAPATGSTAPPSVSGLTVGSTATGKRLATVTAPKGLAFNVVSGAADDRTFVVGATSTSSLSKPTGSAPETWFLLQVSPGSAHVAQLTRLPVPGMLDVTGAALSPDGSELAVSYVSLFGPAAMPTTGYPGLTVWSVATGKALRNWGTATGQITASAPTTKYVSDAGNSDALSTAVHWSPDGRQLAFAWNGTAIRLLDLGSAASRQSDLVQASTVAATIGTIYTGAGASYTCDAAAGWQMSMGGTATCAGTFTPVDLRTVPTPGETLPRKPGACGKAAPAHPALIQQTAFRGGGGETQVLAQSIDCTSADLHRSDTSLGWVSANGKTAIGVLSNGVGTAYDQYGLFTSKKFTTLPPVANYGGIVTVAW